MTTATSITIRIPLTIRRHGGRKLVVTPDGAVPGATLARTRGDPALVKALARAHRWKRLLESGRYGSLAELAKAERIDRSYLAKTLRLTLLAPGIVEAVLDGHVPPELQLQVLRETLPAAWTDQRTTLLSTDRDPPDPGPAQPPSRLAPESRAPAPQGHTTTRVSVSAARTHESSCHTRTAELACHRHTPDSGQEPLSHA